MEEKYPALEALLAPQTMDATAQWTHYAVAMMLEDGVEPSVEEMVEKFKIEETPALAVLYLARSLVTSLRQATPGVSDQQRLRLLARMSRQLPSG